MVVTAVETADPGKPVGKRLEMLLESFHEICRKTDEPTEHLQRFQDVYLKTSREERMHFYEGLIREFEIHRTEIAEDLQVLMEADEQDAIGWSALLSRLRRKLESPRLTAFRKFLNFSGGLKFLLDLRADVLAVQRQAAVSLEPLNKDIAHLFNSWFQNGFLFLHEITVDSPYRQIHYLKDHDMVHPMTSLEEMADRLGEDRRCFALYHVVMPEEPVVFIEAALTKGIARSIHEILQTSEEMKDQKSAPDTAIFYSINSTQNGLAGIGLGKVLIFQVVDALKKSLPGIKTFSTLSPMPGFWDRYLRRILTEEEVPFAMKRHDLIELFPEKTKQIVIEVHTRAMEGEPEADPVEFDRALLETLSNHRWVEDPILSRALNRPLTEAAHFYITQEKNPQGKPLNPVANFHMGNGATVSMKNINFGANQSVKGLEESCGLMVNYVYAETWLHQISRTVGSLLPWKV